MQEIQLCAVCFCCGSFNLFSCINLLVAVYYFIIPRSIFQYFMLCVIYCNLNESQRDLRMISFFVPYFGFVICIKNNTKIQGEGLCAVKDPLNSPSVAC